ncbi:hypothetical protein ACO0M4_01345 [Streptomyces sp. RGM 3693]|uniref:hypothetical protein n=1 Tax=Streptomyces sp. RGM 3693 TaxID=3413284 RepID=UPI003D28622E
MDLATTGAISFTLLFLVAAPLYLWHDHVGSSTTQHRRRQEMLKSFDGRPEVVVRLTGTGMSREETIWLARQHGYEIWKWETYNRTGFHMRMRRVQPPSPPAGPVAAWQTVYPHTPNNPYQQPGFQGIPDFQGNPGNTYFSAPTPSELQTIRRELYRTRSPWNWYQLLPILGGITAVVGTETVRDLISGRPYFVEAGISAACLAGAAAAFAAGRAAARRKAGALQDAAQRTVPPAQGTETR